MRRPHKMNVTQRNSLHLFPEVFLNEYLEHDLDTTNQNFEQILKLIGSHEILIGAKYRVRLNYSNSSRHNVIIHYPENSFWTVIDKKKLCPSGRTGPTLFP